MFNFRKKKKDNFLLAVEDLKSQLQRIVDNQQAEIKTLRQDFEILQKTIFKKTYNDRRKIVKTVNVLLKKYAKNNPIQKERKKTSPETTKTDKQ